jgi:microcystin-dependent protein/predicted DNA binding CopG/RHH family protein
MSTIGTSTLYSGTINGLNSLDLDTLNVTDLDVNNIDGDFFSINTIECNDLQVDNELDLTQNGVIKIGKNTPSEITITDTQLGYLDNVSSNIQEQLNTLSTDLGSAETDIDALQTNTQNLTATSTTNTFTNSTTNFKDAPVDDSITNKLSSFTYFDTNIALMRTASEYRKYWIGMTGDDEDATNRFAIGCNGVDEDQPEILMELDATGEISMRNGIKIFDLQGNNIATINNFSDSAPTPNNTFSIRTLTGSLFLQSNTLIDAWTPSLSIGQTRGSTLTMRSDVGYTEDEVYYPPTYKSRIILNDLTLFGGLGNVANDASIELNGEIQNHAYTDADHTAVEGIVNIETEIQTLQDDLDTAEDNILTLQTEMDAVELLADANSQELTAKQYSYNPTGSVQIFAGNVLPTGYLWCNGAEISQTTYADLYTAIGTIYSTNRKTSPSAGNFFLPDLRGCFISGAGQPQSTSFNFKITPSSKSVGQFREMSVQDHKHNMIVHDGSVTVARTGTGGSTSVGNDADTQKETFGLNYADSTSFVSNPYISAGETQPFNICMNYIIKY